MKTIFLLFALAVCASAQSIAATTADGRKVTLNSDGTWRFDAEESQAVINIEAALVYQSGDVRPMARVQFLLLDADLRDILSDAKLKPVGEVWRIAPDVKDQLLITYGKASLHTLADHESFWAAASKAVTPHVLQSTTTGFDGKAALDPVPPRSYYLVAVQRTARGWAIWNLKIEAKSGQNKIIIDANNAARAY